MMWTERGRLVLRPRAGAAQDVGDLLGLPFVQSVKNHKTLALASWVDGMAVQCGHAGLPLGVVWHKRRGKGHPHGWYVTTRGDMAVTLLESYVATLGAQ
jgi:hypothetical protein